MTKLHLLNFLFFFFAKVVAEIIKRIKTQRLLIKEEEGWVVMCVS